jgi:transposase-like protein
MQRNGPQRNAEKQRFWQRQLARWRQSRQSVREFCRENALSEPSFYAWRRELTRRGQSSRTGNRPRPKASQTATTSQGAGKPTTADQRFASVPERRPPDRQASKRPSLPRCSTPSFLPVRVVEGPAAEAVGGVEIVLAHDRAVRVRAGFDRQTLAEVLAVLEARPC